MAWAILAVITFVGHMVAGLYAEFMYFLAEYIWCISVALSVIAIYRGAKSAGIAHEDRRGLAIASALIGAITLLGLMISASSWLFVPENSFDMMASLR
jgi:hypothetical protein